jgi:branched-chain amino acid transport system permease protein
MSAILQHVVDAVSLGSLYALTALGIGLIFGVMRLINFAHGDFIMVGAFSLVVPTSAATSTLLIGAWPAPLLIAGVCGVVMALALATERLAFRPVRRAEPSVLLITSFAVSFFLQNAVIAVHGGRAKSANIWPNLMESLMIGGVRIPQLQLITIVVTIVLLVALVLFLKRTAIGVAMRAASEDFMTARLLGIRANHVIAAAFAISGLLAAVVSLLYVAQTSVLSFHMGVPLVLFAFVATVVGGMGNLIGAVVGGFVVGIGSVFFQVILPEAWRSNRDVWVYGLVLLILLFRPAGLIKSKSMEEKV